MAIKQVTYKEPESYFNEDMKKAAAEWERENKERKDDKKSKPSKNPKH